jgi:pimeloyl-ACP methyl ester carboxylesterase
MTKTMVMIHGMWGGGWYWENYKTFLEARGWQCHTPTLRHHDVDPKSPPPAGLGATSLLDYAADLEAFIKGLGEKPVIMGHSMGGLLAQMLGARDLAQGLVLLTPASPSGINALKVTVIKSFWSVLTKWGFWHKPQRLPYEAAVYAMLHLLPEGERRAAYDKFVYESGRAAAEIGFWLLDPTRATKIDAAKITCPVLVIAGAEDRVTPATVVKNVARKYRATYQEFPNHAHWVLSESGWEDLAGYIADWLERFRG